MLRNGVKHVTMDDIATQLGMSKKTIYQFYKDKDALVMAVVNFELEEQSLKCQSTQDTADNAVHEMFMLLEDIQQMFKNMNPMTMNELAKYYPEAFLCIQNHKDEFMHRIIKTNLIKGIEQGVYRKEIDPEILSIYRLETSFVPFNPQLYPFSKFDIDVGTGIIPDYSFCIPMGKYTFICHQWNRGAFAKLGQQFIIPAAHGLFTKFDVVRSQLGKGQNGIFKTPSLIGINAELHGRPNCFAYPTNSFYIGSYIFSQFHFNDVHLFGNKVSGCGCHFFGRSYANS